MNTTVAIDCSHRPPCPGCPRFGEPGLALAAHGALARMAQRAGLACPTVSTGERLGFLPGDLMAKVDPYLRPLWDALHDMVGTENAGVRNDFRNS